MVGVSKGLADLEVGNSLADVHIGGVVLLILADSHWGGEHWGYSYSASLPPLWLGIPPPLQLNAMLPSNECGNLIKGEG